MPDNRLPSQSGKDRGVVQEIRTLNPLAIRDRRPELMDQPGLDPTVHGQALRAMGRINFFSRTVATLWRALAEAGLIAEQRPLRVLEIASGGGEVAIGLAQLGRRRGVPLEVHGCDISPTAVDHAQTAAAAAGLDDVRFQQFDALHDPLPDHYDVLLSTLFFHHLDEPDAAGLLARMAAAARRAVVVDDLVRSRFGYVLAWAGGRLLTRSPIVHVDGPLSVRAALSREEWRALFERAGLGGATFRPHWPERLLMLWGKPS